MSMDIKDIQASQGNIEIVADVVRKESVREFEKFGKVGKVCSVILKDSTGEISFSLWNDDIEKLSVGDKVQVQGGWCSEFKSVKQLSAGKYGKFEVIGKSDVVPVSVSVPFSAGAIDSKISPGGLSSFSSPTAGSSASDSLNGGSSSGSNLHSPSSTPSANAHSSSYSSSSYSSSKFKYAIDEGIELLTQPAKGTAVVKEKGKVFDPYDDGESKSVSEDDIEEEDADDRGHEDFVE